MENLSCYCQKILLTSNKNFKASIRATLLFNSKLKLGHPKGAIIILIEVSSPQLLGVFASCSGWSPPHWGTLWVHESFNLIVGLLMGKLTVAFALAFGFGFG